jgi:cytochrome P450
MFVPVLLLPPPAGLLCCFAGDPSVLRFLIAAREEVNSTQLRDDLLSMLVAGHETTGSALTWTLYLLVNNPEQMAKAQVWDACTPQQYMRRMQSPFVQHPRQGAETKKCD